MMSDYRVDKSGWGPGPWDNEPDRIEWRWRGYPCLIVRSETSGALCGYVGLPPGHPWYGRDYEAIHDDDETLRIHGGLTFTSNCNPDSSICHVPLAGESDEVWWIGFDCAHCYDYAPGLFRHLPGPKFVMFNALQDDLRNLRERMGPMTYRNVAYVRRQVARLLAYARRNLRHCLPECGPA